MTERSLNMKAKKFIAIQSEIKELEDQLEKIKKEIQNEMGNNEELATEKYTIKWIFVNQSRFDTKAFKVKHPDLYSIFAKDAQQRRFSVAEKGA